MKIKNLKLKNFAEFTDFECEFDGKITRLVGFNESGKSTIGITAIWACIKGIAEKSRDGQLIGERFRFIGSAKKSAEIELTLVDEIHGAEIVIKNHITKSSNQITFKAPEGYELNENWLNNLLSVAFLSAKNFTQLSGKQQAILLGIDTSTFDTEIEKIKQDYTIANREYKAFGELEEVVAVERVSISELLKEKDVIDKYNKKQGDLDKEYDSITKDITDCENTILLRKKEIEELEKDLKDFKEKKEGLKSTDTTCQDTSSISDKINNAESTNLKAYEYESYQKQLKLKKASKDSIASILELKKKKEGDRLDYIKAFDFGLDTMSVDDKGNLLIDDKPVREPYFSKGKLEIIVAGIHSNLNPELKVRFIDDFDLLDEKNQKLIVESLLAKGFQVITAEVGEKKGEKNILLLRKCKTVEEKTEEINTYGIL